MSTTSLPPLARERAARLHEEARAWWALGHHIEEHGIRRGLCSLILQRNQPFSIAPHVRVDMETRIALHMGVMALADGFEVDGQGAGPYLARPGDAAPRVLACYPLALECEDEARR